MLFTAFVLRENIHPNYTGKIIIAAMIIAIVISTIIFIINNNNRIKYQCRIVVRIEEAFGLYKNGCFIELANSSQGGIFPDDAKEWGVEQKRLFLLPPILGVIFSGISAISSIFIELSK